MPLLQPHLVLDSKCELAEGPVWHEGALWFVDINAGVLHRFDPAANTHEFKPTANNHGGVLGAAIPCVDGHWLLAHKDGFALFDWISGRIEPVATLPISEPSLRLNDAKADPSGRVWVGTMHTKLFKEEAALYRLDHDHAITKQVEKISLSNGIAWSADGSRMYFIDTPTKRVDVFDFQANASAPNAPAINRRPLAELGRFEGAPDGMTIDTDDNLWVAIWGGSKLVHLDGTTGEQLDEIVMPVSQPTSCGFGGEDFKELYITTAHLGMNAEQRAAEPHAGGIFKATPTVGGMPPHLFGKRGDR